MCVPGLMRMFMHMVHVAVRVLQVRGRNKEQSRIVNPPSDNAEDGNNAGDESDAAAASEVSSTLQPDGFQCSNTVLSQL